MKLRIIAGKLKRRVINIPSSSTDFRPTKEIVRESLSNMLSSKIINSSVADICSGSGAFGIEMLSRGANSCDFFDISNSRCKNLEKHLLNFKIEKSQYSIICSDIKKSVLKTKKQYDIIFYDPPYDDQILADLVPDLYCLLNDGGILVYEREWKKGKELPVIPNKENSDVRKFGQTEIISWIK